MLLNDLQLTNAVEITYCLVICITKVSILLLYLRMFSPSRTVCIIIHVNLWANVLFYTAGFFVEIFECVPREAIWNPRHGHSGTYYDPWDGGKTGTYKCVNQDLLEVVSAVFNLLSDFAILLLPISTVWYLQMRMKKKVAVLVVFATGLL